MFVCFVLGFLGVFFLQKFFFFFLVLTISVYQSDMAIFHYKMLDSRLPVGTCKVARGKCLCARSACGCHLR